MDRFEFLAPILLDPGIEDGYMKHYVPIPLEIADALIGAKRLVGELDGHAFRRTLQNRPNGEPCLRFGKRWLLDHGLAVGAVVPLTLGIDPDPDRVDIPSELHAALEQDQKGAEAWANLTPGKKRTMAYHISQAKKTETRVRRALVLLKQIKNP